MAVEKGFWGKAASNLGVDSSLKTKRNLSELLMLIVAELGEACEALRKNKRQVFSEDYYNTNPVEEKDGVFNGGFRFSNISRWEKDTFEDELADAMIRIADLAESEGIDLEWQIEKKLAYNEKRPYKHGKSF